MKNTKIIMGMPITIEIADQCKLSDLDIIFDYFSDVDNKYSPYKDESELARVNEGLPKSDWSVEFTDLIDLCEETKNLTNGYFDINHNGKIDPSGLVKGWAIYKASEKLFNNGFRNFYIEAGGDIQVRGEYKLGIPWRIGIRSPFNLDEIVKVVEGTNQGIATSGSYIRGDHIYNPHDDHAKNNNIRSLTVIGPNIYEADRFATAAFAMGERGIEFIERLNGFEGYQIDNNKIATFTPGFEKYVTKNA